MKAFVLAAVLLGFLPVGFASASITATASEGSRTGASSGIDQRLDDVDFALEMARRGDYGRLSRSDLAAVETAHRTVHSILGGVDSLDQLAPEQLAVVNAAITDINELLQVDDKNRRICKRISVTGSRLGAMECLTVTERELRAKSYRNIAGELQRGFCMPGPRTGPGEQVSSCTKQ
jgi:hypothetical protein